MRKKQNYQWEKMTLGTCYYPEHWDKSLWREDLQRMLACGITTIRIGEFAWSKVEPREGEFTYEFFGCGEGNAHESNFRHAYCHTASLADQQISGGIKLPDGWGEIPPWHAPAL